MSTSLMMQCRDECIQEMTGDIIDALERATARHGRDPELMLLVAAALTVVAEGINDHIDEGFISLMIATLQNREPQRARSRK